MDGILGGVHAEFVGGAVDVAAADAAAGEEGGEGGVVVVATGFGVFALGVRGASEFAGPDDEGVF